MIINYLVAMTLFTRRWMVRRELQRSQVKVFPSTWSWCLCKLVHACLMDRKS